MWYMEFRNNNLLFNLSWTSFLSIKLIKAMQLEELKYKILNSEVSFPDKPVRSRKIKNLVKC